MKIKDIIKDKEFIIILIFCDFRITICLMTFVNYGGGGYYFFQHSIWNGM